jgi:hypothetical protein
MIPQTFWCPNCGQMCSFILARDDVARCTTCQAPVERMGGDVPEPGRGGPFDGGQPWSDPFDGLLYGIAFVRSSPGGRLIHSRVYAIDPADPDHPQLAPAAVCGVPEPYARPREVREWCPECQQGTYRALGEIARVMAARPPRVVGP